MRPIAKYSDHLLHTVKNTVCWGFANTLRVIYPPSHLYGKCAQRVGHTTIVALEAASPLRQLRVASSRVQGVSSQNLSSLLTFHPPANEGACPRSRCSLALMRSHGKRFASHMGYSCVRSPSSWSSAYTSCRHSCVRIDPRSPTPYVRTSELASRERCMPATYWIALISRARCSWRFSSVLGAVLVDGLPVPEKKRNGRDVRSAANGGSACISNRKWK